MLFLELLRGSPELAAASFTQGATRQDPSPNSWLVDEMAHCIYFKDTALHFAAASYSPEMTDKLIEAGANVRAKIRRGTEPLSCCSSRKSRLVPMGSGGVGSDDLLPHCSRCQSDCAEYGRRRSRLGPSRRRVNDVVALRMSTSGTLVTTWVTVSVNTV